MSLIIHILLGVVAIFFLAQTIKRFVSGKNPYAVVKFFATFVIWSGVLFFALFPELARIISTTLHLGENLNTLIFIGFVIVFIFLFRLLRAIEKMERDMTALVREKALEDVKNK